MYCPRHFISLTQPLTLSLEVLTLTKLNLKHLLTPKIQQQDKKWSGKVPGSSSALISWAPLATRELSFGILSWY